MDIEQPTPQKRLKNIFEDVLNKNELIPLKRKEINPRATIKKADLYSSFKNEWAGFEEKFKMAQPNLSVHHLQHAILFGLTKSYDFQPK